MQIIWTILLTVLVFGVIIFIHELGHFLAAKWSDIKVHEFSLGMGPKIFGFKKGDTDYNLRLFPIGGFVNMEGEDKESDDVKSFGKKPLHKKIFVILAGAFMNLLLGFILLVIILSFQPKISSTTVAQFRENSISSKTGLQVGDKIEKINGTRIYVDNDIIYKLYSDKDGVVGMSVIRDGQKIKLDSVKFNIDQDDKGNSSTNIDFLVKTQEKSFFTIIKESWLKTVSTARLVWLSLMDLVTGRASINDLSGPIGVAGVIGEASSMGILSFLMMVSFITINIGVFNILPIPALDGGRFVFLIVEKIIKKPINPKIENYIHSIGFILLILLMIFVTFNDIFKIFKN